MNWDVSPLTSLQRMDDFTSPTTHRAAAAVLVWLDENVEFLSVVGELDGYDLQIPLESEQYCDKLDDGQGAFSPG